MNMNLTKKIYTLIIIFISFYYFIFSYINSFTNFIFKINNKIIISKTKPGIRKTGYKRRYSRIVERRISR